MMGNADIGGWRLRFWVASHLVLETNNGQWPNEASMGEYMNILPIALKGGV